MHSNPVKKILILAASPQHHQLQQLRLQKEVEEIRTTLQLAKNRDDFEIESHGAVCPEDLHQHFHDFKPQIVHFSGHGVGEQGLAFENAEGGLQLVDNEALGDLFRLFARQIECVMLNACYAKVQAEVIQEHIPYVIGMNKEIGDTAARTFAKGFYRGIWDGRTIEESFAFGINAIDLAGISEADIPVLLKRQNRQVATPTNANIEVISDGDGFYVVRSREEQRCYEELRGSRALIRIRSPQSMGKTFMKNRIIKHAAEQGYRTAEIDLLEANQSSFNNINEFLQWFCGVLGNELQIDQRPRDFWKDYLGASTNCNNYLKKFFIPSSEAPLVIAIDNLDRIFKYPEIDMDFCGLLRSLFEKGAGSSTREWGKLRQILVYSQTPYATYNINQSPFNVGYETKLEELNSLEIIALANAYGLSWAEAETKEIMDMIGGHPCLVKELIEEIVYQSSGIATVLKIAPTEAGIYKSHLNQVLQKLEEHPELREAIIKVLNSDSPTQLRSAAIKFRLDGLGLTKDQDNGFVLRNELYRLYLKDKLL